VRLRVAAPFPHRPTTGGRRSQVLTGLPRLVVTMRCPKDLARCSWSSDGTLEWGRGCSAGAFGSPPGTATQTGAFSPSPGLTSRSAWTTPAKGP
jgi:hypothetical protein